MLSPERLWLIKLNIHVSIATGNLVITPSPMSMVLRANIERYYKLKRQEAVFQCRSVFMFYEIVDKFFILLVYLFFLYTEAYSRSVNNRKVASYCLDKLYFSDVISVEINYVTFSFHSTLNIT